MNENNKDKEQYVSDEVALRTANILSDAPIKVKLGDKTYNVRALRVWSRYRIFQVLQNAKHTEAKFDNIIKEAANNLDIASEMVAIILCNDKFTTDMEENERLIKSMQNEVLIYSNSESEWCDIVVEIIKNLGVEEVFQLTALLDLMTKSLAGRKDLIKKRMQQQS